MNSGPPVLAPGLAMTRPAEQRIDREAPLPEGTPSFSSSFDRERHQAAPEAEEKAPARRPSRAPEAQEPRKKQVQTRRGPETVDVLALIGTVRAAVERAQKGAEISGVEDAGAEVGPAVVEPPALAIGTATGTATGTGQTETECAPTPDPDPTAGTGPGRGPGPDLAPIPAATAEAAPAPEAAPASSGSDAPAPDAFAESIRAAALAALVGPAPTPTAEVAPSPQSAPVHHTVVLEAPHDERLPRGRLGSTASEIRLGEGDSEVRVSIRIEGGKIYLNASARSDLLVNALAKHQDELRQFLGQHGLTLASFTLGSTWHGSSTTRDEAPESAGGVEPEPEAETPPDRGRRSRTRAVA